MSTVTEFPIHVRMAAIGAQAGECYRRVREQEQIRIAKNDAPSRWKWVPSDEMWEPVYEDCMRAALKEVKQYNPFNYDPNNAA